MAYLISTLCGDIGTDQCKQRTGSDMETMYATKSWRVHLGGENLAELLLSRILEWWPLTAPNFLYSELNHVQIVWYISYLEPWISCIFKCFSWSRQGIKTTYKCSEFSQWSTLSNHKQRQVYFRNMLSKCPCSCAMQLTRLHSVSSILHRPQAKWSTV